MRWFLLALALGGLACTVNGEGDRKGDDDDGGTGGSGGVTTGGGGGSGGGGTNGTGGASGSGTGGTNGSGTGGTNGSGTGGTGGTGGGGGGASGGGTGGAGGGSDACVNITGLWVITGSCGATLCTISQTDCSTSLSCGDGSASYTGSLAGNQVSYSGESGDGVKSTCQGAVNGDTMTGTCTNEAGTCAFTGDRQ